MTDSQTQEPLVKHSLKRRVILVLVACSMSVLTAATFVFLAFQALSSQRIFEEDLRMVTRIIADNCSAPLAFKQPREAGEVLSTLRSRSDVIAAHVHAEDGSLFASFGPTEGQQEDHAKAVTEGMFRQGDRLVSTQPIEVNGDRLGDVCVVTNYGRVSKQRMLQHVALLSVLLPSTMMLAWGLASWLQRRVSAPVLSLAATARTVTEERDYSVRAEPAQDEELAILVTTFNRMLAQMEHYSEELERAVAERTTDLRLARDTAEEASRAKSQFLANMSHEVRTPINGIMGMLHVLRQSPLTPRQARQVQVALDSSETLLTVLGDVLDFSRIEAGHLTLEHVEFDPVEAMERPIRLLAGRAAKLGLELVSAPAADLPDRVRGDPHRLSQILLNLIGNALKFSERGEIVIRCSSHESSPGTATLRFEVRDTGKGIAPDDQARIFEAFEQADGSMTRVTGGVGLGLAISRQLCTRMGGKIGVESQLGMGSTFWFTIHVPTLPTQHPPAPNLAGLRVLVVTSSPALRHSLHEQLTAWSADVSIVETPEAAAAHLRHASETGAPTDIVLTRAIPTHARAAGRPVMLRLTPISSEEAGMHHDSNADIQVLEPVSRAELREAFHAGLRRLQETAPHPNQATADALPAAVRDRILVADDDTIGQDVICEILEILGYRCRCVATGSEALSAIDADNIDLVLINAQLPDMDGNELARRIRAREVTQGGRRSPVLVALAGSASEPSSNPGGMNAMDDFLAKPVEPDQIATMLRRWLNAPIPARDQEGPVPVG